MRGKSGQNDDGFALKKGADKDSKVTIVADQVFKHTGILYQPQHR